MSTGLSGTVSNDSFNSVDGSGSFDCTFPDGPANSDVSVQVEDSDGEDSNIDTISVTIANVAPVVTLNSPSSTDEGNTEFYSFTTVDPGDDTFVLLSQSCGANGTLSNDSFTAATGAGSFDCTFPDGPNSSDVSVQVEDSDGEDSNIDTISVTIADVAPVVTLNSPSSTDEGNTESYSFNTVDLGDDTFVLLSQSCGANGTLSNDSFNSVDGSGQLRLHLPRRTKQQRRQRPGGGFGRRSQQYRHHQRDGQ